MYEPPPTQTHLYVMEGIVEVSCGDGGPVQATREDEHEGERHPQQVIRGREPEAGGEATQGMSSTKS